MTKTYKKLSKERKLEGIVGMVNVTGKVESILGVLKGQGVLIKNLERI